jgi:hypothetical protein
MVAGRLQLEPRGGPGFRLDRFTQNNVCTYFPLEVHGPETYRRAVYHQNARASVVDVLSDFDLPDIAFAAPRRANTTTPLQALTLLNHGFTVDLARALAARNRWRWVTRWRFRGHLRRRNDRRRRNSSGSTARRRSRGRS